MSDRLLKESDVLRIAFQLPLVVNSAFADAVKALPSADRPQGEWIPLNTELIASKYDVLGYHRGGFEPDTFMVVRKGADDEDN